MTGAEPRPVTQDFINPEAPWPALTLLKEKTEAAGYELRERLAIYPEFARQAEFVDPKLRSYLERWLDTEGYAQSCAN